MRNKHIPKVRDQFIDTQIISKYHNLKLNHHPIKAFHLRSLVKSAEWNPTRYLCNFTKKNRWNQKNILLWILVLHKNCRISDLEKKLHHLLEDLNSDKLVNIVKHLSSGDNREYTFGWFKYWSKENRFCY